MRLFHYLRALGRGLRLFAADVHRIADALDRWSPLADDPRRERKPIWRK